MGNSISYMNVTIGIIALSTNVLIITCFGLDLYGTFALVLLCQSLGSILFDLGYSNIIIQQRSITSLELKNLALLANAAVITVVIASLTILSDEILVLNTSILIFWCVCSVRSTINVALLQREKKIMQIIVGDGMQVIIFIFLASIGTILARALEIEILSYLLISQLIAQATKAIYTQLYLKKHEKAGNFSMHDTKELAFSQVMDRSTRLIVSKGEQIVFTLIFSGAELGLFLFLSNVSVQFFSRLSSPQTRYIVALSKDIPVSRLAQIIKNYYNKYFTTICLVTFVSGVILVFGANFIVQLEQVYNLLVENYNILILITLISLLRIDMDFYLAWLVSVRKYYLIPVVNLIVGILILLLIFVFVNIGSVLGLIFGFCLSFGFRNFENFIDFKIGFWYRKTIILLLLSVVSVYCLIR